MDREDLVEAIRKFDAERPADSVNTLPTSIHVHFHAPVVIGDQLAATTLLRLFFRPAESTPPTKPNLKVV
jgi:hypothetical protein